MQIEWTFSAQSDLRKVYKFYELNFSVKIAQKVVSRILKTSKKLKYGKSIGQEEELLKKLNQKHRYLLSDHNKIIYKVEQNVIYITHVFDTRQNPNKLK
jgi:plasmid stabilization system protein ParE